MPVYLRLPEEAELRVGLFQDLIQIAEGQLRTVSLDDDGARGSRTEEADVRDGQTEDSACVEGELREVLRNHRYHARVVRTGRYLAEYHVVAFDKEFHAEDTATAEGIGDSPRDVLRLRFGSRAHRLGLPRLAVVAVFLHVADRLEERGAPDVAHGELRNLVIKIDEALDDDLARAGASAFLGIVPSRVDVGFGADDALPMTAGTHDGFDHARHADDLHGLAEFLFRRGEAVGRGGEAQFLGGEAADAFAVHRQPGSFGRRDDVVALFFQLEESLGGDGLDFRDNVVGLFTFDDFAQRLAVEHGDDVGAVCHLHGGRVGVFVEGDDLDAVALEFDYKFFS